MLKQALRSGKKKLGVSQVPSRKTNSTKALTNVTELANTQHSSGFSISKTTRGSPMITLGGYEYTKDYEKDGKVYWKCRSRKCKQGRAVSFGYEQEPFYVNEEHDCKCLQNEEIREVPRSGSSEEIKNFINTPILAISIFFFVAVLFF
jgi:hypothetical protein